MAKFNFMTVVLMITCKVGINYIKVFKAFLIAFIVQRWCFYTDKRKNLSKYWILLFTGFSSNFLVYNE